MNTPQPTALDHRTFLQQYVLAGPFETPISPEQLVSEADDVWDRIEAAVAKAAAERKPVAEVAPSILPTNPHPLPDGWSQTEPSGYVAKYPTTGEPLATPEVDVIPAPPLRTSCPHPHVLWSVLLQSHVCSQCGEVPGTTPMSKRP